MAFSAGENPMSSRLKRLGPEAAAEEVDKAWVMMDFFGQERLLTVQ
jgi:hypothetical protein